MASVPIPAKKQKLLDLADSILAKAGKAAKEFKVRVPGDVLGQIRKGRSLAVKNFAKAHRLKEASESATEQADEGFKMIAEGARTAAQILKPRLKRQGMKSLKKFGLPVQQTKVHKKPKPESP